MPSRLPHPSDVTDSHTGLLLTYVDFYRERVLAKFHDLPERARRTSDLPSGWTPAELLHHLRHVERRWLEWGFLDPDLPEPWGENRDGRWYVPAQVGDGDLAERLRAQGLRTREIVTRLGPGARGRPGERWEGAPPGTVERVLLHLLQEYARHLGQLDVVVERATGAVGE